MGGKIPPTRNPPDVEKIDVDEKGNITGLF